MPWESEAAEEQGAEEDVGAARSAALSANSLLADALLANGPLLNALSTSELSTGGLSANAPALSELASSDARQVLRYIVSCALEAGEHIDLTIDGEAYPFDGQLGLAPSWGDPGGSCDAECKAWVSGCVIARINNQGVSVPISVRGDNCALGTTNAEIVDYPVPDGTYYGDIFGTPMHLYACLPSGSTSLPRVCGPSLAGCAVTATGWCDQNCDPIHQDGSYSDCWDGPKSGSGATTVFPGSVTIYLH